MSETRQGRRTRHTRLLELRINAGWSRVDLALKAGVGRETVRLAELGSIPTPRVQMAIASAFDLRPLDLWPIERQRR
jgi:transcriptional regulator with XRE-family HTH domain